jgi:Subtilase family/PKD domain
MRVTRVVSLITLLALSACRDKTETPLAPADDAAASVAAARAPRARDRYIIHLSSRSDQAAAAQLVTQGGGRVHRTYRRWPMMAVQLNPAALAGLQRAPFVVSIVEDKLSAPTLDNSLATINADEVQSLGWTGSGFSVVILDTGIDKDHDFVFGRVVWEACFSSDGGDDVTLCPNGSESQTGSGAASINTPACQNGSINLCEHGMHVAGIAAGDGNALSGAPKAGVAPGATIIAIQVFTRILDNDDCVDGGKPGAPCILSYDSDQAAALEYVVDNLAAGGSIAAVNMSLGGGENDSYCLDSRKAGIDDLHALNIATVVSAGNSGFSDAVGAPACVENAITIGATDNNDNIAGFSNRGILLDLFAPGVSITSSISNDGYDSKSGTSAAAPHVTGAWAVMRQALPNASVNQLNLLFRLTGVPITYSSDGNSVTTPRIDLAAALRATTDPPVLTINNAAVSVNEGSTATNGGTFNDPNGDPVAFKATVGSVSSSGGNWTWSWPTIDGPANSQTVTVIGTDNRGAADTVEFALTVANVPPIVNAGPDATLTSNQIFTFFGAFSDPGLQDFIWGYTVDWGDGTSSTGTRNNQTQFARTHLYCAAQPYTIRLTVTDKDNGTGFDEMTLTVNYLAVTMDITPAQSPNSVSLSNRGLLPVALLSSATFNAPQSVDLTTLTLGDGVGTDTHVAKRQNGTFYAEVEDVNKDGLLDLVLRFSVPALVSNGDLTMSSTQLFLRGFKTDGCTNFQAVDSIRTVS